MVAAVSQTQTQTQTPGAMQVSPPRVRRQQDFPIIELDITVNNVEFHAVARKCRRKRVAKPPPGPRPVPRPNATLGPHGGPDNRPADVVQSTTPVQADGKRMDRLVHPPIRHCPCSAVWRSRRTGGRQVEAPARFGLLSMCCAGYLAAPARRRPLPFTVRRIEGVSGRRLRRPPYSLAWLSCCLCWGVSKASTCFCALSMFSNISRWIFSAVA